MDALAQLNASLDGRYNIEREIGRGGMATVYLALDVRHSRPVALKVLNPDLGVVLGAATLTLTPEFSVRRRVLFEGRYLADAWHRTWDLSPDGKHFLVVREVGATRRQPTYVVHNWAAEVRARRGASR